MINAFAVMGGLVESMCCWFDGTLCATVGPNQLALDAPKVFVNLATPCHIHDIVMRHIVARPEGNVSRLESRMEDAQRT